MNYTEELNEEIKESGFAEDESQIVVVMIGKTGHCKSTLGNRICGDVSRRGNAGPFEIYGGKDKAGTDKIRTGNPLFNPSDDAEDLEESKEEKMENQHLGIVDTPGWGDVDKESRELC